MPHEYLPGAPSDISTDSPTFYNVSPKPDPLAANYAAEPLRTYLRNALKWNSHAYQTWKKLSYNIDLFCNHSHYTFALLYTGMCVEYINSCQLMRRNKCWWWVTCLFCRLSPDRGHWVSTLGEHSGVSVLYERVVPLECQYFIHVLFLWSVSIYSYYARTSSKMPNLKKTLLKGLYLHYHTKLTKYKHALSDAGI
jgi:hypothetical protein